MLFVIREENEVAFRSAVVDHIASRVAVDLAFQSLDDLPDDRVVPPSRSKPWGTCHAVLAARRQLSGPFCVINADDFYGRSSFAAMAQFLRAAPMHAHPAHFSMVGFELRNTLSAHGTVSRGVCQLDTANHLAGVEEITAIQAVENGAEVRDEAGLPTRSFTGHETVSMNMWGFTPQALTWFEDGFRRFLDDHGEELKSEYFIPLAIDQLIRSGKATVEVLRSAEKWFGVTYLEDKPFVQAAIAEKVATGEYQSPLWG